jgi:hypothetical protein
MTLEQVAALPPRTRAAYEQYGLLSTTINGTDVWLANVIYGKVFPPIIGGMFAELFVGSQPVYYVREA